ncbi:hypothetical protein CALCODRAFT_483089 [Calocera cornea HHB12733]|uniref:Uncharacterized protein n=1 Tax=Calocera cornea HHB12733 TaxID=1353952 RepID=A0A165G2V2_9BASI|nr:hypothetical protein CALCODRAFT_483089 [Calocera cornea HHB12733]
MSASTVVVGQKFSTLNDAAHAPITHLKEQELKKWITITEKVKTSTIRKVLQHHSILVSHQQAYQVKRVILGDTVQQQVEEFQKLPAYANHIHACAI